MKKNIYFFLGTEAELMKMFSTIKECKRRGYSCTIVASGQNKLENNPFLEICESKVEIDLADYAPKTKNVKNYISWMIGSKNIGIDIMRKELKEKNKEECLWVVHGDTLTTLLGAQIARKIGIDYIHVESGLRSFNLLSPFPEEIDRYYASKYSKINFCPKEEYALYAERKFRGKAVNTFYNTGIETLNYALEVNRKNPGKRILDEEYFLLAIHRQENLYNGTFLKKLVEKISQITKYMKCVFIYHVQTEAALKKYNLWDLIYSNSNIIMLDRRPYIEFVGLVDNAEFVIADGCGNQQEFYYLGKPYLIMRSKVEKDSEGLGENAVCYQGDFNIVDSFVTNYRNYKREPIKMEKVPSRIIADTIDNWR